MANHPNRSKYSRLNILISSVYDDGDFAGLTVYIRRGYSELSPHDNADLIAGREHTIPVRCATIHEPSAKNNIGLLGASVVHLDAAAVQNAVLRLVAQWGDIPVQDNSGKFGYLASRPGVLII